MSVTNYILGTLFNNHELVRFWNLKNHIGQNRQLIPQPVVEIICDSGPLWKWNHKKNVKF